eukprot:scaffold1040_cov195-Pinguiococcus_pyrenoidosus.AAC.2
MDLFASSAVPICARSASSMWPHTWDTRPRTRPEAASMIKGVRGVLFALLFVATRLDCANALARPRSGFSGSPNPRSRFTSGSDKEAAFAALELRSYNSVENIVVANKKSALWRDPYGSTLLHRAVLLKDSQNIVRLLVSQGAKLNALDKGNNTALHHACLRDNIDAAIHLVKAGANIHRRNAEGFTAFGLLMMRLAEQQYGRMPPKECDELLLLLLERGADITEDLHGRGRDAFSTSFILVPRGSAVFDTLRHRLQNMLPELMNNAIQKEDLKEMICLVHMAKHAALSEERYTAMRAQLSASLPRLFESGPDSVQSSLGSIMGAADRAGEENAKTADRPYQLLKQWQALMTKQLEEMQKARLDDSDNWYG